MVSDIIQFHDIQNDYYKRQLAGTSRAFVKDVERKFNVVLNVQNFAISTTLEKYSMAAFNLGMQYQKWLYEQKIMQERENFNKKFTKLDYKQEWTQGKKE